MGTASKGEEARISWESTPSRPKGRVADELVVILSEVLLWYYSMPGARKMAELLRIFWIF
jgi:hypothetical protein